MGEHQTWFDLLRNNSFWQHQYESLRHTLGIHEIPFFGGNSHFTLNHVYIALLVVLLVLAGAWSFRAATKNGSGLVPPPKWNLRNLFEILCDTIFGLMVGVFGSEAKAKKFFPLIGSIGLFVLFGNLFALLPGFGPATDTLKTNLMLGLIVFFATHYYGFKENGFAYLKHFMGPILVLAPLFFCIEMISHIARPASLSLRLLGNMAADHKVLFTFFTLLPFVPILIPFYFLGSLVCVVQALVFCLLSMVYISLAILHDH